MFDDNVMELLLVIAQHAHAVSPLPAHTLLHPYLHALLPTPLYLLPALSLPAYPASSPLHPCLHTFFAPAFTLAVSPLLHTYLPTLHPSCFFPVCLHTLLCPHFAPACTAAVPLPSPPLFHRSFHTYLPTLVAPCLSLPPCPAGPLLCSLLPPARRLHALQHPCITPAYCLSKR